MWRVSAMKILSRSEESLYLLNDSEDSVPDEYNTLFLVSESFGFLAMFMLLVAQMSQITLNFERQSSGTLPFWFWSCWLIGDVLCLIQGLALEQPMYLVYLNFYFCLSDVINLIQSMIYPEEVAPEPCLVEYNFKAPLGSKYGTRAKSGHENTHPLDAGPRSGKIKAPEQLISRGRGYKNKLTGVTILSSIPSNAEAAPVQHFESFISKLEKSTSSSSSSVKEFMQYCINILLHGAVERIPYKMKIAIFSEWVNEISFSFACVLLIIKNYKDGHVIGVSPYLFPCITIGCLSSVISSASQLYLLFNSDRQLLNQAFYVQFISMIGSLVIAVVTGILAVQSKSLSSSFGKISKISGNYYIRGNSADYSLSRKLTSEIQMGADNADEEPLNFKAPDWYANYGSSDNFEPVTNGTVSRGKRFNIEGASDERIDSDTTRGRQKRTIQDVSSQQSHIEFPPTHYILSNSNSDASLFPEKKSIFTKISRSLSVNNGTNNSYLSQSLRVSMFNGGGKSNDISSPLDTSLIPSLIGSYSSVSKKMANESKVPFSPSDFLSIGDA